MLLVDPSQRGGIASYTQLIARALAAEGVPVEVLGSKELAQTNEGLIVHRALPSAAWGKPERAGPRFYIGRALLWLRSARVIRSYVRRLEPDVVHFQAPINRRFDARLVRQLARRAQVVWTAHDVVPLEGTPRDKQRFRRIYRAADVVIVHTEPAKELVRDLAEVDAHVVEHVAAQVQPISRETARARLGLPARERIVSALGFIRPYKGYALLASVWGALGDDAPILLLLGEADGSSDTREVVSEISTSPRALVRPGYVDDETLALAVAASDALLLPYVVASDSGLLNLARALGVPVIASDAPQLAAAVRAGKAGLVLPRTQEAWTEAVQGELPPPPLPGASLSSTAASHLALYAKPQFHLAVYSDAQGVGGAEIVLATLLGALPAELRVTIVVSNRDVANLLNERRPGAEVVFVPEVRSKRDVIRIWRLWRTIRKVRADVFHANLRHPWACQFGVAAAVLSGQVVLAVEHYPVPASAPLQRRLKSTVSRRLGAHVAVGKSTARTIETLANLAPRSVRTIHNGVLDPWVVPAERVTTGPVIVAAGRFVGHKAFHVLLDALSRLEGVSLVLVGDGAERPRLERLATELGIDQRVQFVGWREDAGALLAAGDVVALSSTNEGFPLVALEGMALGKPVVTTNAGSTSEAVVDGQTGFVVPVGDAEALAARLRQLADDPQLAKAMGERGRERFLAHFTAAQMAKKYEVLYGQLWRRRSKWNSEEIRQSSGEARGD